MWVALDEADEENGCVWYVKGSADRGMRPHEASGLLGFSQKCSDYGTEEDLKNEMPMRAAPGDVVVHHSLMLHRAGPNVTAARPRRALGLIFYGQVSIDEERHAAYQAELAKRLQSDGII
jgi:phytanoyl-CoA hydroxylase